MEPMGAGEKSEMGETSMGSKFCNLNVFGGDLAAVEAQCPGLAARAVSPGWITAAGDGETDWGEIRKLAKRLSKDWIVLYTEYFDDDYVDFSVYRDGRRAARHVPAAYEGFPRIAGKPRAWVELFGLSPDAEKTLRAVFRETNPEGSLRLLECLLGCPLWVDREFLEEAQPPEPDYLRDYLAQKAAEKKIKNATKLTLLDEQVGDFSETYPLLRREEGDPKYERFDDGNRKSVWAVRDGRLRRLFEVELPGGVWAVYEEKDVLLVLLHQLCRDENGEPIPGGDLFHQYQYRYFAYLLSEDGTLRDSLDLGEEPSLQGIFLDRDWIFLNDGCYDLRARRWEWPLEEGLAVSGSPPCRLSGGRVALRCYRGSTEYLITFLPDGSERVTRELPSDCGKGGILAYGDGLLLNLGRELVCYDAYLTERWRAQLREGAWAPDFYEMQLDETSEMLYLQAYDRVISFDLRQHRIRAERQLAAGEHCFLHGVLPGVGAVMLVGDSTIQVWDADLKLISRHRTKGAITRFLRQDGKTFLLTRGWPQNDFRMTENGYDFVCLRSGCLRLYELKK